MVDFASADLLSVAFWRRLGHTLRAIQELDLLELERLELQRALAAYQATVMSEQPSPDAGRAVDSLLERIRERMQPWAKHARSASLRDALKKMEADWAAVWGDPADPETAAKIEEACRKTLA